MSSFDLDKYLGRPNPSNNQQVRINPELQPYVNLWAAVIKQAIKDNGKEWLKSEEFKRYSDFLPFDIRI